MRFNVFTDFHHNSLLYSLILLFEKRLGGNVFRPIGLEWFKEGYWGINDQQDTAEQFLGMHSIPKDGTPPLNNVEEAVAAYGLYYAADTVTEGGFNKAITLDAFWNFKIDIVIASMPQHLEPFKKLCELHPNKPKLIYQIGNAWNIPEGVGVNNVMASAAVDRVPEGVNFIQYHQEFDTKIFKPSLPDAVGHPLQRIYSYINILQNHPDYALFLECERLLPEWEFKSYGGQCRDGNMNGSNQLAESMQNALFIWHTKSGGDGYGHILHNAAAVARPVIVRKSDYSGKLGDKLLIDGETCIAIDNLSASQIVDKIIEYSKNDIYEQMCRNVYWNFQRVVDFEQEAEDIKLFLSNLK